MGFALVVLSLPSIALGSVMRSGFEFPGIDVVQGENALLEDCSQLTLSRGLRARSNDIVKASDLARRLDPRQKVLFCGFIPFDVAYFALFFRDRAVKIANEFFYNQLDPKRSALFSSNQEFLETGDMITNVVALCGPPNDPANANPLEDIIVLRGQPEQVAMGQTFVDFQLPPGETFVFVRRIFSQVSPPEFPINEKEPSFSFWGMGIAFGVYKINGNPQPGLLRCDVVPYIKSKPQRFLARARTWQCHVNGAPAKGWKFTEGDGIVHFEIPLPATPAGCVVEIAGKEFLPMDRNVVLHTHSNYVRKPRGINLITNFTLEDSAP